MCDFPLSPWLALLWKFLGKLKGFFCVGTSCCVPVLLIQPLAWGASLNSSKCTGWCKVSQQWNCRCQPLSLTGEKKAEGWNYWRGWGPKNPLETQTLWQFMGWSPPYSLFFIYLLLFLFPSFSWFILRLFLCTGSCCSQWASDQGCPSFGILIP